MALPDRIPTTTGVSRTEKGVSSRGASAFSGLELDRTSSSGSRDLTLVQQYGKVEPRITEAVQRGLGRFSPLVS